MTENLRREVLRIFKQLHKTRKYVFRGDENALKRARERINEEYQKHKHLTDETAISEKNRYALEVENVLRRSVVRLVEKKPGLYEAEITKDTEMIDNAKLGNFMKSGTVESKKK